MVTLTKALLAQNLEEQIGLMPEFAMAFVEHFFEEIMVALEHDEEVKLAGLGKFGLRQKAGRPGRNPKTGESIPITPRRVVSFRISASLRKNLINPHS